MFILQEIPGILAFLRKFGNRFGSITGGWLPIGSYEPRWFMKSLHVNPDEAVKIYVDCKL